MLLSDEFSNDCGNFRVIAAVPCFWDSTPGRQARAALPRVVRLKNLDVVTKTRMVEDRLVKGREVEDREVMGREVEDIEGGGPQEVRTCTILIPRE